MGSFCAFLYSDNRIDGDSEGRYGLAAINAAVCFVMVVIGWSFIDGWAVVFWEGLVVLLWEVVGVTLTFVRDFGGDAPFPSLLLADMNCSGDVDNSDLVYLADYMYTQGPPPDSPQA